MSERRIPHPLVAMIPVVVLIGLLIVVITLFGSDALSGGSQIALLLGLAVCDDFDGVLSGAMEDV